MQTDQEEVPTSVDSPTVESKETVDLLTPKVTIVPFMMQKKYSESISLSRIAMSRSYKSEFLCPSRSSFSTGMEIVPRMKPRYHTTVVRVDGEREDTVIYQERVELAYCMLMREFSEAVNNFPYETKSNFTSTLTYDPDYVDRRFITSLEIMPALMLTILAPKSESAATCNGEEMRMRNKDGQLQSAVFLNGTVS